MSYESNSGSVYYPLTCGKPSDLGIDLSTNTGTVYYRNSALEYILCGQEDTYPQIESNSGSQYYFLECDVPSDIGLDLQSNSRTHYYYSSSFNCVGMCDTYYNYEYIIYNEPVSILYNGIPLVLS